MKRPFILKMIWPGVIKKTFRLTGLCAGILTFGISACAQTCLPPAVGCPNGSSDIKNRSIELERVRRQFFKLEWKQEPKFPAIKSDFEKIQIINTEKIQKKSVEKDPDYKMISDSVRNVEKLGSRLSSNLFPTETGEGGGNKKIKVYTAAKLDYLIIALDNAIYHFVSNPVFRNLKVVDPKDSEKAQSDLSEVIGLSRAIVKMIREQKSNDSDIQKKQK